MGKLNEMIKLKILCVVIAVTIIHRSVAAPTGPSETQNTLEFFGSIEDEYYDINYGDNKNCAAFVVQLY